MSGVDLSIRSDIEQLVREERLGDLLALIATGLPLKPGGSHPRASSDRAVDLLLAYKNFAGAPHPAVFDAWISRVAQVTPAQRLHTELCTIFVSAFTKMRCGTRALRALIDAIERVQPAFLRQPVDERALPLDLEMETLERAWRPGQARRTPLGIAADSPHITADLLAIMLPQEFSTIPAATSTLNLLEYIPQDSGHSGCDLAIRSRFKPKGEDLDRMGDWALERLSTDGLPLVGTGPKRFNRFPAPRKSALGAIVWLDAGAAISQSAWSKIACTMVKIDDSRETLPLAHALVHQISKLRTLSVTGGVTLQRLLESGTVRINEVIDKSEDRLLHIAAAGRNVDLVGLLLANGADPRQVRADGMRPRDLVQPSKSNIICTLLDAGAARLAMAAAISPGLSPLTMQ